MDRRMINRQYMLDNVLAFLEEQGDPFKEDPQFQTILNDLHLRVQEIQNLRSDLEIARMPLSERKARTWKTYGRKMARLSKLLQEVAVQSELEQLSQFLSDVRTKISHGTVDQSLVAARELMESANTYKTELLAMTRGQEVLDDAQEAMDAFSDIALSPMRRVHRAGQLNSVYQSKVAQAVKMVKSTVESYFFSWEEEYPDVYGLFLRIANIPDLGGGSSSGSEEDSVESDDSSDDTMASDSTSSA